MEELNIKRILFIIDQLVHLSMLFETKSPITKRLCFKNNVLPNSLIKPTNISHEPFC